MCFVVFCVVCDAVWGLGLTLTMQVAGETRESEESLVNWSEGRSAVVNS